MKLAHISDSHFSERLRLGVTRRVHTAIVDEIVAREGVHLILHTGDVYDAASTPLARQAAADFFIACAGIAPVVIVKGNHDATHDLELLGRLESEHKIHVISTPAIAAPLIVQTTYLGNTPAGILGLPWIDKHAIAATAEVELDTIADVGAEMDDVFSGLLTAAGAQAADMKAGGVVPIFAAHLMVTGSEIAEGQALFGVGPAVTADDIADVGAEYHALGHVHRAQSWHDGRVAYAGSPTALNFGEPERKSFNFVELPFITSVGFKLERILLPAPRLVRIEIELDHDSVWRGDGFTVEKCQGAIVRVRAKITPEQLAGFPKEDIALHVLKVLGAIDVKVEPVVQHTARERVAGFGELRLPWDKVSAWLDSKGVEKDLDERHSLAEMFGTIEKEVRDATA